MGRTIKLIQQLCGIRERPAGPARTTVTLGPADDNPAGPWYNSVSVLVTKHKRSLSFATPATGPKPGQPKMSFNPDFNNMQRENATAVNQKIHLRTFPVEHVSWLEQIFEMLAHSALHATKSEADNGQNYSIHLADTLVFRYQRPAALYYMEDGMLRSSNDSAELAVSALLLRFATRSNNSNADSIVAIYVYVDRQCDSADTQEVAVEYLTFQQLDHFLRHRGKENDGILQQFLPSCGTFQTSVRVFWTTRGADMEVYSSVHRRDEHKVHLKTPPLRDSYRHSANCTRKVLLPKRQSHV